MYSVASVHNMQWWHSGYESHPFLGSWVRFPVWTSLSVTAILPGSYQINSLVLILSIVNLLVMVYPFRGVTRYSMKQ